MKKIVINTALLASLICGSIGLNSCDRVKDAVEDVSVPVPFAIKPDISEQKIPFASIPLIGYYSVPVSLNIDVDAEIKKQSSHFSINNVKSAKLESMSISLTNHTLTATMDALKSARLYLKAPGKDRILVATADGAQITANKIDFSPIDTELIEYFKTNQNSIDVEMQGAKLAAGEMTIKINPSFKISVGL